MIRPNSHRPRRPAPTRRRPRPALSSWGAPVVSVPLIELVGIIRFAREHSVPIAGPNLE